MLQLDMIGKRCKHFRTVTLNMRQSDVAEEIGCSRENVAAFEQGRNNNLNMLLWYMSKGLTIDDLQGGE